MARREGKKLEYVERIVIGEKPYSWRNPKTGEKRSVSPGETILVSKDAARAHTHRLMDPKVHEAQLKANVALVEEEENLDKKEPEKVPDTAQEQMQQTQVNEEQKRQEAATRGQSPQQRPTTQAPQAQK